MTEGSSSGRPLRIVFAADTFAPDINGSASFTKRLAVALVGRGHDVHIVAPAPDRHHGTRQEVHDGVELTVHRLYSWRWPWHDWLRFALPWRITANARRILRRVEPDVVHFQSHIVTGRGFAIESKKRGVRLIGTNHTMPENIAQHVTILPQFLLRRLIAAQWTSARKVFGLADEVTSPTRSSADYFEEKTGIPGVHAISNGIDVSNYTPDFARHEANRVVFVGRLDDEKHVDELIEATAKLDPALDAQVDIIGVGESRPKLEQLARDAGVADRVHFRGKVSDEELRGTLTRATVFAMPSRAELQCIAAMEAMATALPVVAANAMALPHLVHDGENGFLYRPGDIEGLAERLTAVLSASKDRLDEMKRASQRIVARHDMERTVDAFERLYRGESVIDPIVEVEPGTDAGSTAGDTDATGGSR